MAELILFDGDSVATGTALLTPDGPATSSVAVTGDRITAVGKEGRSGAIDYR